MNFNVILHILNSDWDPIGLKGLEDFDPHTDDEYAGYARELTSMLTNGADASQIADYLQWAERHIGIDVSIPRIEAVTENLLLKFNSG